MQQSRLPLGAWGLWSLSCHFWLTSRFPVHGIHVQVLRRVWTCVGPGDKMPWTIKIPHQFYFRRNIGFLIIPIDFHIFQRGGPTTNQIKIPKNHWTSWQLCQGCQWNTHGWLGSQRQITANGNIYRTSNGGCCVAIFDSRVPSSRSRHIWSNLCRVTNALGGSHWKDQTMMPWTLHLACTQQPPTDHGWGVT